MNSGELIITVSVNGNKLFEAKNYQQASEMLYVLNKNHLITSGQLPEHESKKKPGAKKGEFRMRAMRGGLTSEQKEEVRRLGSLGLAGGQVINQMGLRHASKLEKGRIYGYLYQLRKDGAIPQVLPKTGTERHLEYPLHND